MSAEVIDGATIVAFVEDDEAFGSTIGALFAKLDTDQDGLLSHQEMIVELSHLRVFETHFGVDDVKLSPTERADTYDRMFGLFDKDSNGSIDLEEFKAETKRMLLGVAGGIGFSPVQMLLEEGSLLKKAVEREYSIISSQNNNNKVVA